ncbi:MAG: GAF domain-containing protein [Culicoidibacterales bacterium]
MFQRIDKQLSQTKRYEQALLMVEGTLMGESDLIARLANISAVLNTVMDDINWVGFYLSNAAQTQLIIGPFQGQPACTRIAYGKGVCGTAVLTRQTQRVADVQQFPGHIACDAKSQSELVVPLVVHDQVIGVLDIDAPIPNRFQVEDQQFIEAVCQKICNYFKNEMDR